jgi:ubiquinone/menaquinone biosynthesis C-methylase UbiE
MCSQNKKIRCRSGLETSKIAYWSIRIMHDNPILPLVKNPYRLLNTAGLNKGQQVLEVGCGPGFFTIPASRIVGEEGHVYAVDINPLAVARVKEKIKKEAIQNVTAICVNASNTGLPDKSIDLAFLFGLRYIAGGLKSLIFELHRVLRQGGILSFEKTRGPEDLLIEEAGRGGFLYTGRQGRIFLFKK